MMAGEYVRRVIRQKLKFVSLIQGFLNETKVLAKKHERMLSRGIFLLSYVCVVGVSETHGLRTVSELALIFSPCLCFGLIIKLEQQKNEKRIFSI